MMSIPGPRPGSESLPAVVQPQRAVAPALAATPEPIALLKALRRRWLLALGAGLFWASIAAVVAFFLVPPTKYTARAMLHVNSVPPRILLAVRELNPDYGAYQRTQLAMLKSRLVLNAALKQQGVAKLKVIAQQIDPIGWLERQLQVDFANGSEILRIAMSGDDAAEPMVLVNAVTQAYLDEVVDVEAKMRRDRYEMLKQTWNRYQENLREKRKELRRLTEVAGSDDKKTLANLHQLEIDRLGRAETELARVESELRSLRVEFQILQEEQALNAADIAPTAIEAEVNKDHSIELLDARMAQSQRAIDQVSRLVRNGGDPSLQRHRNELEAARTALLAQKKKLYPIVTQQLQERARSGLDARTGLLQERIKILTGLEQALAADVKRLSDRTQSINRHSVDLFSIQDEIAAADDIAKAIRLEVESLDLELQAPARIRLLEKAELPRTKDESRAFKMAGMAGCGTFALVLVGVSFWEFRAQRVDSALEVASGLGIKLVGTLPALPQQNRLRSQSDAQSLRWQNLLIESVDAARTALLHASRTESVRIVMIASALSGEGKTSLASHLATSLARSGRRTLLIDGDLRRPSAHQLFDLPSGPGLSEVLRDELGIADAIRPTLANGLWLLPAGTSDNEAIQALAYKDLRAMFDRLKEAYDFIVVDSSPILPVADALVIGQQVDAVLFSIMRDVSRIPKVHAACERMSSLGIRMLGAVVTGEQSDFYGNSYQYAGRAKSQP
jgi:capsular exopolysaccharide synthesis family protein